MSCETPFDILKSRSEDLGEQLYLRASWKDPWLTIVPKDTYPAGAGYVRTAFTIGRSEPTSEEEAWQAILPISEENPNGACNVTYNQAYTGFKENDYEPEMFGLVGPLVCQDDLVMHWRSADFWEKYFQALQKRNVRSLINRLANIYMNYVPKCFGHPDFGTVGYVDGDIATQPPAQTVDLTTVLAAYGEYPQCNIDQDILDETAGILMEEGADEPNTNGWITHGQDGPEFPLLIGHRASKDLLLLNSDLKAEFLSAYATLGAANPVIQRLGASRIIKNFRHIITRFPPRWQETLQGTLSRVPVWTMSTAAGDATKGRVAVLNPDYRNPAVAKYEGCIVLNPWVFTEEVLNPMNSAPGLKLNPQNYFGEWDFITGNDALIGFDDCTGVADPKKKLGRHFAEYRHAAKPIFPMYGRLYIFARCPTDYDCVSCSASEEERPQ